MVLVPESDAEQVRQLITELLQAAPIPDDSVV
jgi:hypothetical protein